MLATLSLLTILGAPAHAADPALPSRPTTYPVDTGLTEGVIPNLRELYVSPESLLSQLQPVVKQRVLVRPPVPKIAVAQDRLVLNDKIYFDLDKSTIREDSQEILDLVVKTLEDRPGIIGLRIEGHTDAQGEDAYNLNLSDRRAAAVRGYLVGKGISEERLKSVGFGETQLVAEGSTPEAHARNRRVAFMIEEWDEDALEQRQAEGALVDAEETRKQYAAELERLRRAAVPEKGAVPIINETNGWAKVSVNGIEVGVIGPLTNAVVHGAPWGYYDVTFFNSVGFEWTTRVLTVTHEGAVIPGGPEAGVVLEDWDRVPSWWGTEHQGHVDSHEAVRPPVEARKPSKPAEAAPAGDSTGAGQP